MTPASPHDPYAALRERKFLLFIFGFFISVIGSQMQAVAARYEIYQKTHADLSLGWVGLALAIPMLVLTLPAGQLADMRSRRRLMAFTMLICAASCVGMAWVSYFHSTWEHSVAATYVLLGLGATGATLGRPARAALMPQLVSSEVFPNAVTWNASLYETASAIGPAIGGLICARSIALAYVLSAVFFVVCTVMIWMLPEPPAVARKSNANSLPELVAGLRFVWKTKLMLAAMTLDLFAVLFGGATYLLPAYAEKILHVGPTWFGWLCAASSIGAVSMALIQAHLPPLKRAGPALLISVAAFGLAWVLFGMSQNVWLSFFLLVVTGALDNISVVIRHTLVQMLTPNEMRGRVSAVNQIFIGSSNELGGLESGLTGAWLGTVGSVVYGGIATIAVVGASTFLFPELRKLRTLASAAPATEPVEQAAIVAESTDRDAE